MQPASRKPGTAIFSKLPGVQLFSCRALCIWLSRGKPQEDWGPARAAANAWVLCLQALHLAEQSVQLYVDASLPAPLEKACMAGSSQPSTTCQECHDACLSERKQKSLQRSCPNGQQVITTFKKAAIRRLMESASWRNLSPSQAPHIARSCGLSRQGFAHHVSGYRMLAMQLVLVDSVTSYKQNPTVRWCSCSTTKQVAGSVRQLALATPHDGPSRSAMRPSRAFLLALYETLPASRGQIRPTCAADGWDEALTVDLGSHFPSRTQPCRRHLHSEQPALSLRQVLQTTTGQSSGIAK